MSVLRPLCWDMLVVEAGIYAHVHCGFNRGALGDGSSSFGDILGFFPRSEPEVAGFFELVGETAALTERRAEWRGLRGTGYLQQGTRARSRVSARKGDEVHKEHERQLQCVGHWQSRSLATQERHCASRKSGDSRTQAASTDFVVRQRPEVQHSYDQTLQPLTYNSRVVES